MRTLAALLIATAAVADEAPLYRVESPKAPIALKKGASGKAHFEVVPREDAHVSPDAPMSVRLTAAAPFKLAKEKLGRTDGRETKAKGVEFDVPFTADKAGKGEIKASLSFFICTEKLCEKKFEDVTFAVVAE